MAPAITLLCLPCAGASATMYLRWRRQLPQWLRLVAVELPGRGSRLAQAPVEDFQQLVGQLCEEQVQAMSGSFALFGHSMGALLAYGMAQRQRALGRPLPLALVVSGSPAPQQRQVGRYRATFDDAALTADLRRQGGTPEEVYASPELMRITLDILAADYLVCASAPSGPAEPLPLPLVALAGRQDAIAAPRIEAWAAHAGAGFALDWFDGGHFFIRQQESQVLAALHRRLAQIVQRASAMA